MHPLGGGRQFIEKPSRVPVIRREPKRRGEISAGRRGAEQDKLIAVHRVSLGALRRKYKSGSEPPHSWKKLILYQGAARLDGADHRHHVVAAETQGFGLGIECVAHIEER